MAFTYRGQSNPSGTIKLEQSRSLLASQSDLEQILIHLKISIKEGTADQESLLRSITTAQACLPAMDRAIPKEHKNLLYPERTRTKGAAQKVFDVTELLEMVLGHLTTSELLAAQFVNRQFRDIINESTELQRHLMLEAYESDVFSAPFEEIGFPGLQCQTSSNPIIWADDIAYTPYEHVEFVMAKFLNKNLNIGSRCRSMLLTQPPIKKISVSVNCCNAPYGGGTDWKAGKVICNWSGITIGDLINTTRALEDEHSKCWSAHPSLLNEHDGSVNVEVTFQAQALLRPEEPRAQAAYADRVAFVKSTMANRERDTTMHAWWQARIDAWDNVDVDPGRWEFWNLDFTEWRKSYLEAQIQEDADDEDD